MTKAKMMLIAIGILGLAGGAVALKIKPAKSGINNYCTDELGAVHCGNYARGITIITVGMPAFKFTITDGDCTDSPPCVATGSAILGE